MFDAEIAKNKKKLKQIKRFYLALFGFSCDYAGNENRFP